MGNATPGERRHFIQAALIAACALVGATAQAEDRAPRVSLSEAGETLFLGDDRKRDAALAGCDRTAGDDATIACLIEHLFAKDRRAAKLAVALYREQGTVVGLEAADRREVGWRGMVKFQPALPVGKSRKHLQWVVEGLRDIDRVMERVARDQPMPYRWRALRFKYYTTPGRKTPSAYAWNWTIAWNVRGSLHRSARAVRETLFHEIFHLNDQEHSGWSKRALAPIFDGIVKRCTKKGKLSTPCLAPFSPGKTKVRGSTYYAFHPGNGVGEYAAELALRYYVEHRMVVSGKKFRGKPFKCGTRENAEAWDLLVEEFFGGIDRTPTC